MRSSLFYGAYWRCLFTRRAAAAAQARRAITAMFRALSPVTGTARPFVPLRSLAVAVLAVAFSACTDVESVPPVAPGD